MNEEITINPIDGSVVCPKCGKSFASAQAYRMHNVRVHTAAGQRGYRNAPPASSEQIRQHRRDYQRRMRERFYAQGLSSKGKPYTMPGKAKNRKQFPSDSNEYKRAKYQQYKARNAALGLNARGKPLKGRVGFQTKAKRFKPIVYTPTREEIQGQYEITANQQTTKPNIRKMNHCPYCGENIVHHLSMGGWN